MKSSPIVLKILIGLGLLTILSGLALIVMNDVVPGLLGIGVGLFLVFLNSKYLKALKSE